MKRVKITEKQAERLGLNKINKNNSIGLKEGIKNIVKISKEQYNRIFASGLINEEVAGGLSRVDKSFKKTFSGKNIQNLDSVSEDKFNITKPNRSIPTATQKFGKPIMESEDQIKKETIELIKFLYRKSEEFSPFWTEHGLTYDDICKALLGKNLIINANGKYELSKTLGSPQQAIQAVEDELRDLTQGEEGQEGEEKIEPSQEIEEDNYPAGAANDSNAPWNQTDSNRTSPMKPKHIILHVIAYNGEIALLKSADGTLYVFFYQNVDKKVLKNYASVEMTHVGKDEDGNPDYDYGDDFDIDDQVFTNYVNDNLDKLSKGEGVNDYEQGIDIIKIDDGLKNELMSLYDKDKSIAKALGPIEETWDDTFSNFKDQFTKKTNTHPSEDPKAKQSRIVTKLAELKAKEEQRKEKEVADLQARNASGSDIEETTGAASSGAFTGPLTQPVVKREMPDVPIVGETTAGSGSVGAYDANALPGINRDGSFKETKKTNAQKKTQMSGGGFVKFNDCTKLNNKPAGSGCSKGAVDNVVSVKKTKGNVTAPSLSEDAIYETIAKKTGKSIESIKTIIESKKSKA